jgi:hypothetical protein
MATDLKQIVAIRGTEDYRRALAELARRAGAASINDMAERAIVAFAAAHGLEMPGRTTGTKGGPRPGAGRPEGGIGRKTKK